MQIWKFIAPGLYKHEKNAILPYLVLTPILIFFRRDVSLLFNNAFSYQSFFYHLKVQGLSYKFTNST